MSIPEKIFISFFSLGVIMILSCGQKDSTLEEPFFFIQMADTQFGMYSDNQGFEKETELFEKAINLANQLQPAFVVVCGDLVNIPGDSLQISEYLRIVNQLNPEIPIYHVAGNHDVENSPTNASLAKYRKNFGKDYYTFEYGNCSFIVLNSGLIQKPENVQSEQEKQWRWLQAALKQAAEKKSSQIVIFQHHPYFLNTPDEVDEYFNIPLIERKKYLDLFTKYQVSAVFVGHYHRNSYGKFGDLEMVTSSAVGKPLGADSSGFRIVKVFADHLKHDYYALDAVPSKRDILLTLEIKK